LNLAKKKAATTACLSNTKNLSLGWYMYMQDNDGRIMSCEDYATEPGGKFIGWCGIPRDEGGNRMSISQTEPPVTDELREKAEKRVNQRMALYSHIGSYIIINGFLILIWALTGAHTDNFWPVWVMLGWGIGLAFHIFGYITGKRSDAMREKMLQKELDKVKKEQGPQ